MTRTAWVFPGQGSQVVGMGADLLDLPSAKAKFATAEKFLGWSVAEICQSSEEKLSKTVYTQPCLYVVESILADLFKERSGPPALVAGHSLGEYVALYVAGVFDFETGLRLVKQRADLMASAQGGEMVALIGFDRQQLELHVQYTSNVVIANDNSDAQVVISGTPGAVAEILSKVKIKKSVKLNVSGAFHSPLMSDAAGKYQQVLRSVNFNDAKFPVISNVEPMPSTDAGLLKQRLAQQMTGAVRWREICLQLPLEGVTRVVEVGPGKVLTGLIKRTCPGLELENVGTLAELKK